MKGEKINEKQDSNLTPAAPPPTKKRCEKRVGSTDFGVRATYLPTPALSLV